jgi:replicative DNA helicase
MSLRHLSVVPSPPSPKSSKKSLSPREQFEAFIRLLKPLDDSYELWFKYGHDRVIKATWDATGRVSGTLTKLLDQYESESRVSVAGVIGDLFHRLDGISRHNDGGIFYIPTQPQKFPLKKCISKTDDIGIELDHGEKEEQLDLYRNFQNVSGIKFSCILSSGGKSIHAHIKADEHYPIEQMHRYRWLAAIAFLGDPAVTEPHQPMRVPGFWRKEKGAYQELIGLSSSRYSLEELEEGFRKWFEHINIPFPEKISETWWRREIRPLLADSDFPSDDKRLALNAVLLEGCNAWEARKDQERIERQRRAEQRRLSLNNFTLEDLVTECDESISSEYFWAVDWHFSKHDHARGQCPFHKGTSGNSAWIEDRDGRWKFHCSVCTNNEPRGGFNYFCSMKGYTGIQSPYPSGNEWVAAAKEYVEGFGKEIPEWVPLERKQSPSGEEKDLTQKVTVEKTAVNLRQAVVAINDQENPFERVLMEQKVGTDFGVRGRSLDGLLRVVNAESTSESHSASDVSGIVLSQIMEKFENPGISGYETGFVDLDAMIQGFNPGDLVIIAGRPSMGKTALGMSLVANISKRYSLPSLVFSLEMSKEQLFYRLIGAECEVSSQDLQSGRISVEKLESAISASRMIGDIPLDIQDEGVATVSRIKEIGLKLKNEQGIVGSLIVDYLQLVTPEGGDGRTDEVSKITRALKILGKEMHCPIFAISQLSRGPESRTNKRPLMSDLRESGSIEQDADTIMLLYRDDYYDPQSVDKGIAEVIIAKQRNGPTGTVKLLFQPEFTKFKNLAFQNKKSWA